MCVVVRSASPSTGTHGSVDDHVITSEQLPFVCQTIEVTTENEEQTVTSSHSYPLQISPVSSCGGKAKPPKTFVCILLGNLSRMACETTRMNPN